MLETLEDVLNEKQESICWNAYKLAGKKITEKDLDRTVVSKDILDKMGHPFLREIIELIKKPNWLSSKQFWWLILQT